MVDTPTASATRQPYRPARGLWKLIAACAIVALIGLAAFFLVGVAGVALMIIAAVAFVVGLVMLGISRRRRSV